MLVLLVVTFASIANNYDVNKEYLQKFAKHLKKIRKEKKLTQDDLVSDTVSRSMISLIEIVKTDLTISTAKSIADALHISMKELFDFEE